MSRRTAHATSPYLPAPQAGELRLGKQGVYLLDRAGKIVTFQLIPWQQFAAVLQPPTTERRP